MTLAVVCAVAAEANAVKAGLGLPKNAARATLTKDATALLFLTTGIGPVNAAFRLGEFLARHTGIAGVVNFGIAGSYDLASAPLLATLAATSETWPEYGLRRERDADPDGIRFPLHEKGPVRDSIALDPAAAATAMGLGLPDAWKAGASVTVAGVSADPAQAAHLAGRCNALTENMEGFALALICHDKDLPFLEARVISNRAGSRDPSDWRLSESLRALGESAGLLLGRAETP